MFRLEIRGPEGLTSVSVDRAAPSPPLGLMSLCGSVRASSVSDNTLQPDNIGKRKLVMSIRLSRIVLEKKRKQLMSTRD